MFLLPSVASRHLPSRSGGAFWLLCFYYMLPSVAIATPPLEEWRSFLAFWFCFCSPPSLSRHLPSESGGVIWPLCLYYMLPSVAIATPPLEEWRSFLAVWFCFCSPPSLRDTSPRRVEELFWGLFNRGRRLNSCRQCRRYRIPRGRGRPRYSCRCHRSPR